MRVEASAGRLEDTYPIGAEGRKSVHEDGAKPLLRTRGRPRRPLHVRDSRQESEWAGNEDEVEFGLSNYLGYPVHAPDGTPYGTVCVLDSRPRDYSAEERALLEELRRKVEALLAETVS
ncbi:GAF domain-containing protein [Pseudomonas aeruginosa]